MKASSQKNETQLKALRIHALEQASKRIAPAWSLKNQVAVNPYLGYTDKPFEQTAGMLEHLAGIRLHMPVDYYRTLLEQKKISSEDIREALRIAGKEENDYKKVLAQLSCYRPSKQPKLRLITITDYAETCSGIRLKQILVESISNWASTHFRQTNSRPETPDLFTSWRNYALTDCSVELIGVKNFKHFLRTIPDHYEAAFDYIAGELAVKPELLEPYLLSLYYTLPGWSSFLSGRDWDHKLYGGETSHLSQFASILLSWEFCLLQSFDTYQIHAAWMQRLVQINPNPEYLTDELMLKNILQNAFDIACQRELSEQFLAADKHPGVSKRPETQAVFCIDVRSEVFRRNLEAQSPGIQTIGFAGFFGFPVKYQQAGAPENRNQCPVLLASGPLVSEVPQTGKKETLRNIRNTSRQTKELSKKYQSGPVTSFGFVSSLGLFFLPKLLGDAFSLTRTVTKSAQKGYRSNYLLSRKADLSNIPFETQLNLAYNTLKSMNLTHGFAPLVLLTGHGASTVNNPHAASLECGACGGNPGDINALVAATVFNSPTIRIALSEKGIHIPEDTLFLAGLHDTTTDQVTILNEEIVGKSHRTKLDHLLQQLKSASEMSCMERSLRLNIRNEAINEAIVKRSKDWAQVRPEWGLAGCHAFVIAPRNKTRTVNFGGRTFLHEYEFSQDEDLHILEAIMTAPMVVTSWINLQYYASTVDHKHFGAGSKTLHNVTAGIGVMEGSSGDLRIGLPLQSIHNGTHFEHQPQRLQVIIDAPATAINRILKKHESIRNLFDNRWIYLLRLDESGHISERYLPGYRWEPLLNSPQGSSSPLKKNEHAITYH